MGSSLVDGITTILIPLLGSYEFFLIGVVSLIVVGQVKCLQVMFLVHIYIKIVKYVIFLQTFFPYLQ
jgi:hypothetical protein